VPRPERIYIMHCPSAGLYKIGRSRHPRVRALAVAWRVKAYVRVQSSLEAPDAEADEKALHSFCSTSRTHLPPKWEGQTGWFKPGPFEAVGVWFLCTQFVASGLSRALSDEQLTHTLAAVEQAARRFGAEIAEVSSMDPRPEAIEAPGAPTAGLALTIERGIVEALARLAEARREGGESLNPPPFFSTLE
jgi:hypothetical protein